MAGSPPGVTILRPETVALMSENEIGDLEAGATRTTDPALSSDVDLFSRRPQALGVRT